jgi:DNA polymerase-3 subunit beta
MDPADYPAWANFEEVVFSVVPTATLVRMIEKTLFAASADETRFNLNGVRVETTEGKTLMVATDGHRLAFIEEAISLAGSDHLLIPKKGLLELKRVLEGAEETVSLGFDKKNMFVRTDKFLMTIRLIEGEYPPFRKVIPPESDRRLRADRIRMIQALRRTSVLASERSKLLHIDAQPGMIEFSLRHPDLGEAKDVVSAEYDGEQVKLSVNVFYLLEALTAIDTETVRLEFNPEGKPIVLRPEPTDCYFNLVMPMKL